MSEPTTAAGRVIVRALAGLSLGGDGIDSADDVQSVVLRAEAEARRTALDEAIAALLAQPHTPTYVNRFAAIDALTRLRDGASPDSPEVR